MLTLSDLPSPDGENVVIVEIPGSGQMTLEITDEGTVYGRTDSFDMEGYSSEILAKLNRWEATLVGWE